MKSAVHLIIVLLFLSVSTLSAQTYLDGQVTDAETSEPIIFGTVTLFQEDIQVLETNTDLDGNYFFGDIALGVYDIEASYIGYVSQKQEGVIIKSNRRNRLDFAIFEEAHLDEVVVYDHKSVVKKSKSTSPGFGIRTKANGISSDTYEAGYVDRSHYADSEAMAMASIEVSKDLPGSGQMTVGEWNDLHNWKDWMDLLENDDYAIMTRRYDIYPTQRYSVFVVNENKNVLPNIPVRLLAKDGSVLWNAISDNAGKAELWEDAYGTAKAASEIQVKYNNKWISQGDIVSIDEGSNTVTLSTSCSSPQMVDIAFTVDATSSMSDEIAYLKAELLDVIDRIKTSNEDIDFKVGSVFYRDVKDEYLTRDFPFTSDMATVLDFVKAQSAKGGGDRPEAVDAALRATLDLEWRTEALKIAFLILDAPPHEDDETMARIKNQIREAAEKGIKLIPVTASGINRETEFLMKFMAMLTNGTYVFITDHSGIGNAHLAPVVEDYEVELLNDCLVRLITQYSKSYSCDAEIKEPRPNLDINVYPNPCTQYVNIEAESVPTKIHILSANGMVVKRITPTEKTTRVEMDELINGVYTIVTYFEKEKVVEQIILIK